MGGELQSAEDGLPVPHVLQLRFLGWGDFQDDVVGVHRGRIGGDARTGFAVVSVRELGMHAGARLDDHLMAVGHQHPDGVRVEGDPAFLKHDFLGDANAQTLVTGGDLQGFFLGREGRLKGELSDAFLGFHCAAVEVGIYSDSRCHSDAMRWSSGKRSSRSNKACSGK